MKNSAQSSREISPENDENSNNQMANDSPPNQMDCHEKPLEENQVENNANSYSYDLTKRLDNHEHEKTDSLDSDAYDAITQPSDLRAEAVYSESDASKDGSVVNGPPDIYPSSSGNEDSFDGFNNNNKSCRNQSSPTTPTEGDQCPSTKDHGTEAPANHQASNSEGSTNRRKASSRKSQPVRKVVNTEQGEESDYYDSDLEEYFTPIKARLDKKPVDSLQKRRTSKRKRKIHHSVDEDSDYFCIENFLNTNSEEVEPSQPPKEKKKKKKGDDASVPESPNTTVTKTMQNVKLNLPNGMTRVVSLELPSPSSDPNSMLCSLLTGKRYSSPSKGVKLTLQTKENSVNSQAGKDSDQVKKVRFSEQDLHLVPKTVDDHCVYSKDDSRGENVPLILENLLTSPHIDQSHSLSDEVPVVVEDEVLDLSNSEPERPKKGRALTNAQEYVQIKAMQKAAKGNMSTYYNLNKVTLDGSAQSNGDESSEKGFSKTLLSYLTSGKSTTGSDSHPVTIEEQGHEFGGITVVPREHFGGAQASEATEGAVSLVDHSKVKDNMRIKTSQRPLAPTGRHMYYAKSEYIDLNELYCLQKGKRPIFEIEDSDDEASDVIIMNEEAIPKSSSNLESSKNKSSTAPSALTKRKFLSNPRHINTPHPALPGSNAIKAKELTSAAGSQNNKSNGKHAHYPPGKSPEHKTRVRVSDKKLIPHKKDGVDHSMKDGLIQSISFTVSKLDANSPSKPLQLQSLLGNKHKKGVHKKLNGVPRESQTPSVNEKSKGNKAATSLIKSKSPTSSSQGKGTSNRVYNSLLTGNMYVVKDHRHTMPLPEKKSTV